MNKIKENLKETKTNLKMSWHFIKQEKKRLFIMILLSAILSIISVIVPVLSAQLLLKLTGGLLLELLKIAIFMFVIEVTRNIVSMLLNKITQVYMLRTITEIQLKMIEETLRIETSEFDKNSTGTFIDRINNDTYSIVDIFSDLVNYFVDFISNFGILIAALFINFYMFIYFVITSLIIGYVNKKRRELYHNQNKIYRSINEKKMGLGSEIIRGVRDIKLLNAEKGILNKTRKQLKEINNERLKMEKIGYKFNFISGNIRDLFDVVFITLGIILVSYSELTISNFLILYMYRGRIENLLSMYDRFANLIKSYNVSATRVFEVIGDYFKKESSEGIGLSLLKGHIELKNVNFAYSEDNVLNNINLEILPGERVGFVGSSGSGKSTIFNLITKLYRLENGDILIDEVSVNDISYSSLRKNISLIPQNPYIFNFSVLDNLKIGNLEATDDEVILACKKADIYDRIMELENGFGTIVGEGGVTLSGGEKQRLAIARALLKKSNIILFDEATSSLDNITQSKVQKAIYRLDKSKTVLIIAHRLSTVIHCDKIVVIDKGKIIDIGTHQELSGRCSIYQELFKYEEVKNY